MVLDKKNVAKKITYQIKHIHAFYYLDILPLVYLFP